MSLVLQFSLLCSSKYVKGASHEKLVTGLNMILSSPSVMFVVLYRECQSDNVLKYILKK